MAIEFKRTAYSGSISPFWRREVEVLPGGYKCVNTIAAGDVIEAGSYIYVEPGTLNAAIVKIGKVLSGGTTSAPRVSKKNNLNVGDTLMKIGGDAVTTVKDIDRSNSEYDVVTLATAITGLAEGDLLQEADSTAKTPKFTPNAVLANTLEVKQNGIPTLDVAFKCVLLNKVVAPYPTDWLIEGGFNLKTNPLIILINQ